MTLVKLVTIIGLAFSLQGCLWQVANSDDIERASKICSKMNSEIVQIEVSALGGEIVGCSNGESINIWGRTAQNILQDKNKE